MSDDTSEQKTDRLVVRCPHCGARNVVEVAQHEGVCHDCRGYLRPDLDRPEAVCLCGSTRFKDEYREENQRLTMAGKVVLSVGLFGHADDVEFSDGEKQMLDVLHKRKIDIADRVHVINPGGYIGDSTEGEIKYARESDTPVTYYQQRECLDGHGWCPGPDTAPISGEPFGGKCSECALES